MKHFGSYFINEQDCLRALLLLHNNNKPIECDPMYFKGNFWKDGLIAPKYKYDINPQVAECEQADATQLPLDSGSIESIILDPPFLFGKHGKTGDYYSSRTHTIFDDWGELEECYKKILREAHRCLKKNGVCIFKCQDYTDSKSTMTHCHVWDWARETGFYVKDLAILNIPQHKIYNGNTKQRHLRKVHTYFWVLVKKCKGVADAI